MDKNKLIGLILISLITITYSYFEGQKQKKTENHVIISPTEGMKSNLESQAHTSHSIPGSVFVKTDRKSVV